MTLNATKGCVMEIENPPSASGKINLINKRGYLTAAENRT